MADTQFRDTLQTLLAALGSNDPAQQLKARAKIRETLAASRRSWNDLVSILNLGGKHGEKLKKLFALLGRKLRWSSARTVSRRAPERAVDA